MKHNRFPWVKASRIGCSILSNLTVVIAGIIILAWVNWIFFPSQQLGFYASFDFKVQGVQMSSADLLVNKDLQGIAHLIFLVGMGLCAYVFFLFRTIRQIMVEVENTLKFSREVVTLTNRTGWLLMGGWAGSLVLGFILYSIWEQAGIKVPENFSFFDNFIFLLSGIFTRTLGEIFQQGLRLEQETEGLV